MRSRLAHLLATLVGCAVFFLAALMVHVLNARFPCPSGTTLPSHVLVRDPEVHRLREAIPVIDAFATNRTSRALARLIVQVAARDGRTKRYEAYNNEPGAPSLKKAPILPGASRAIRLYVDDADEKQNLALTVVECSCE